MNVKELEYKVIEQLNIDVDRLFEELKLEIEVIDKTVICLALLGYTREEIANLIFPNEKGKSQKIGDRLSKNIYPRFTSLIIKQTKEVEKQEEIAGNWARILNFLLDPAQGFRLNPPSQLNDDAFQASFGREIFLYPPDRNIVKLQQSGTLYYQQGLYYQALNAWLKANNQELLRSGTSNPEVTIYINNCAIAHQRQMLEESSINVYTIAVVVPYYHNQGRIAAETLKGIAQIQLQTNWHLLCQAKIDRQFELSSEARQLLGDPFQTATKIALRVLIVNDPNNLYDTVNQTATALAKLAPQEKIVAVIGHYSSEMTATALAIYDRAGIPLINSSSTSDELSSDSIAFYRLTTPDLVNARHLIEMLAVKFSDRTAVKVAIIYNQNSSYSKSYYQATVNNLERYPAQFTCLTPYPSLSANYYQIRDYLIETNQQQVDIVIIIADGGVEPNSLNNVGAIINRQNCWIVGSATLYQENVLHWLDEQNAESSSQIMACVPWHWQSPTNGCQSKNMTARKFCQLGTHLWGEGNLTWRSATAFDSVSIVIDTLVRYQQENNGVPLQTSAALLEQMDRDFKKGTQVVKGVTGQIKFDRSNGDRLDPPVEIVRVQYDPERQKWQWVCDPQLSPN